MVDISVEMLRERNEKRVTNVLVGESRSVHSKWRDSISVSPFSIVFFSKIAAYHLLNNFILQWLC